MREKRCTFKTISQRAAGFSGHKFANIVFYVLKFTRYDSFLILRASYKMQVLYF